MRRFTERGTHSFICYPLPPRARVVTDDVTIETRQPVRLELVHEHSIAPSPNLDGRLRRGKGDSRSLRWCSFKASARQFAALVFLLLTCSVVAAASLSLNGSLALSEEANDATRTYTFSVSSTCAVTIQSYGYGGSSAAPGGTTLSGRTIVAGGFDPYLSVFAGAGSSATFLASNDDGVCPPGASDGGTCADSTLSLSPAPGTYTLVVAAFENLSFAENLGSGTLGDGFTGLGNYDPSRTDAFAIDIGGACLDTLFNNGFDG